MRIEFTKEWCLRMAQLEVTAGADVDIGSQSMVAVPEVGAYRQESECFADANIPFGRFVSLMRRSRRLTLERLAEDAEVEISELVEIEQDSYHKPEPRTVYQLANYFNVPMSKLMQLAKLSSPKDKHLYNEAIRFAARSEKVDELNDIERAALEAFVSVLSEKE